MINTSYSALSPSPARNQHWFIKVVLDKFPLTSPSSALYSIPIDVLSPVYSIPKATPSPVPAPSSYPALSPVTSLDPNPSPHIFDLFIKTTSDATSLYLKL